LAVSLKRFFGYLFQVLFVLSLITDTFVHSKKEGEARKRNVSDGKNNLVR